MYTSLYYKPIFAIDMVDSPSQYADIDVFHKIGDQYHKVEYLNWHTEGTTWIGGTLDVGFADDYPDIEIDPYSYLYITQDPIQ